MNYKNKYIKYKAKYLNSKNNQTGGAKLKEIYFIRHGETEWNVLGKTQGQEADIPLNENGKEQSRKTGKYLKKYRIQDMPFDEIICSPMKRCKETAELIAKEIGFDKDIIYDDNIIEKKSGNLSGLTDKDEPLKSFFEYIEKESYREDPIEKYKLNGHLEDDKLFNDVIKKLDKETGYKITGVELKEEIITRVDKFIKSLEKNKSNKILVISHSGFIGVLLEHIFRLNILPVGDMSNGKNCSICYCTYQDNIFTMISPQNTEHLAII